LSDLPTTAATCSPPSALNDGPKGVRVTVDVAPPRVERGPMSSATRPTRLALAQQVLPKSALGQAAADTSNMWDKLRRCFNHAEVELSNNLVENSNLGAMLLD
jgi:hypothetical protein